MPQAGLVRLLLGFALVSGTSSWLVARRYEIEDDLRGSQQIISRSERRLQAIIDAEPACVKLVSKDGLLLEMNRAGLDMVDADDVSQLIGRPITDFVHPDDRSRYLEQHYAALDGSPRRMEYRIVGLKGRERWVDSRSVPFDTTMNGSGPQRAVLSVTSDITDRKRLEMELRGAQRMEAVGSARRRHCPRLQQSAHGHQRLHRTGLAHDRRQPTPADDLVEVQKGGDASGGADTPAAGVQPATDPAAEGARRECAGRGNREAPGRTIGENIELVLEFDPALEPVRADPSQLEQVVLNLAVNARDAMPNGGQLRFATEMVDVDAAAAAAACADAARPVRAADDHRHRDRHRSRDCARTSSNRSSRPRRPDKGTGLGLATVYGIVKQSGGYVWVTSELGLGTSFEIYLPPVQEAVEALVRVERSAPVTGGTETILLAEDDAAVRRLVEHRAPPVRVHGAGSAGRRGRLAARAERQ